jgi:hypothetical protein
MRTALALAVVLTSGLAAAQDLPTLAQGEWSLTGRATTTACARGRCATRRQSLDQSFEVTPDGGASDALAIATCPGVALPGGDTVITFVPGRNGWFNARIVDRHALVQLLRDCTGYQSLRLQRLRARVRVDPSGESFELRESASISLVVQGVSAQATVVARAVGSRTAALGDATNVQGIASAASMLTGVIADVAP